MQMVNLKTLRKKSPTTAQRMKRKITVRKKLSGDSVRPRISVFRSAKHIYVQAIDDTVGITLASASTTDPAVRDDVKGVKKQDAAQRVGALLGRRLIEKGIQTAVFDRNGFRYHGRVAAVAAGVREAGLQF